jgi:predicted AAA+ superfamily ATPase
VIGARQTGKTTSINNVINNLQDVLVMNGDDAVVRRLLSKRNQNNKSIQFSGIFLMRRLRA